MVILKINVNQENCETTSAVCHSEQMLTTLSNAYPLSKYLSL